MTRVRAAVVSATALLLSLALAGCAPAPTASVTPTPTAATGEILEIEDLTAEVIGFGQQDTGRWWIAVTVINPNEGVAVPRAVTLNGVAVDGSATNQSRDFPTAFLPGETTTVIVRELSGTPERFEVGFEEVWLDDPSETLQPYRITGALASERFQIVDSYGSRMVGGVLASTLPEKVGALASAIVRDASGAILWADSLGAIDTVPAGNRVLIDQFAPGAPLVPAGGSATMTAQVVPYEFIRPSSGESALVIGATGVGQSTGFGEGSRSWYAVEITNPGPEPVMDSVMIDFLSASGGLSTTRGGPALIPVGTTVVFGLTNPFNNEEWWPTRLEVSTAGTGAVPIAADGALTPQGVTLGRSGGWPLLRFSLTSSYAVPVTVQLGGVCRDAAGSITYVQGHEIVELGPGGSVPVEFGIGHQLTDGGTCEPAAYIMQWEHYELSQ